MRGKKDGVPSLSKWKRDGIRMQSRTRQQHVWEAEAPWQIRVGDEEKALWVASRYWDSVEHTAPCKNGLGRIRHSTRVYGSAPRGKEKKTDATKEFAKNEVIIAMFEREKAIVAEDADLDESMRTAANDDEKVDRQHERVTSRWYSFGTLVYNRSGTSATRPRKPWSPTRPSTSTSDQTSSY